MTDTKPARFLRSVLYANAVFSGVCGSILLFWPSTVGAWLGFSLPVLIGGVGLALLGYAGVLFLVARRAPTSAAMWGFVGLDAGWVAGSFLVLSVVGRVTGFEARLVIAIVALVVGLFAGLQVYGMGAVNGRR